MDAGRADGVGRGRAAGAQFLGLPAVPAAGARRLGISERRLEGGAWATTQRLAGKAVVLVALSLPSGGPSCATTTRRSPASRFARDDAAASVSGPLRRFLAAVVAWLGFLTVRALRASPLADGRVATPRRRPTSVAGAGDHLRRRRAAGCDCAGAARPRPDRGVGARVRGRGLPGAAGVRLRRPDGGLRLFVLSMVGLALGPEHRRRPRHAGRRHPAHEHRVQVLPARLDPASARVVLRRLAPGLRRLERCETARAAGGRDGW